MAEARLCMVCGADISRKKRGALTCSRRCNDKRQADRRRAGWVASEPRCAECGADISSMKSNAVYCCRACKVKSSNRRRAEEGRTVPSSVGPDEAGIAYGSAEYNAWRYRRERSRRVAYALAHYSASRDERQAYSREWRAKNPDKRTAQHQRRRARKSGAQSRVVTAQDWVAAKRRQGGACAYCGSADDKLVMDHIVPLARGGRHAVGNILAACVSCNSSKSALLLVEWRHRKARGGG